MLLPFSYINSELQDPQLISICRAGYNSLPVVSDFRIRRDGTYPYCNIHYVEGGDGEVVFEGQTYPVKEGDLFILGAFKAHEYLANPRSPFILKWMEFTGGLDLVEAILKRWKSPVINAKEHGSILQSFQNILEDMQKKRVDCFTQSKDIYALLVDCIAICNEFLQLSTQQMLIKKVRDYIDAQIDTNLKVSDLAKIVGYSESYFVKFFKEHTGQTPNQMMAQLRHHKARKLLITTDLTVLEIAHAIEYYDASHFIKDFKRYEGMTPLEFRQHSKMYG